MLLIQDEMLNYRHHDSVCTAVPLKLRREILDLAHSKWFSGHLGISKTHTCILELFSWPGLYDDIVNFISNCEICTVFKPQHGNPRRMRVREFPCAPMELVSINFLVELEVTARNNRQILCVSDHSYKIYSDIPSFGSYCENGSQVCFLFLSKTWHFT